MIKIEADTKGSQIICRCDVDGIAADTIEELARCIHVFCAQLSQICGTSQAEVFNEIKRIYYKNIIDKEVMRTQNG